MYNKSLFHLSPLHLNYLKCSGCTALHLNRVDTLPLSFEQAHQLADQRQVPQVVKTGGILQLFAIEFEGDIGGYFFILESTLLSAPPPAQSRPAPAVTWPHATPSS